MNKIFFANLGFKLAWTFTEVLPGEFERDRREVAGRRFPIIGPCPTRGRDTPPLEGGELRGPYLYVVLDRSQSTKYVGVATEANLSSPIKRWIRPDKTGVTEYWAHGTNKKKGVATIAWLKEGLLAGSGPYNFYFSNFAHLHSAIKTANECHGGSFLTIQLLTPKQFIEELEHSLIFDLQPEWNTQKKKTPPPYVMAEAAKRWYLHETNWALPSSVERKKRNK